MSFLLTASWPAAVVAAETVAETDTASTIPEIVISEVQAAAADATHEFVELYNNTNNEINLKDWRIDYLSAAGNLQKTTTLSGILAAESFFLVSTESHEYADASNAVLAGGMNDKQGRVRLVMLTIGQLTIGQTNQYDIIDSVGWGSAVLAESLFPEESNETAPTPGTKSIERCLQDGLMVDTNNNAVDFTVSESINPGEGLECGAKEEAGETGSTNEGVAAGISCEGIVVSELLPNAAGSDTGNEFIEIYNPTTDFVELDGCGLQLAGDSDLYRFAGVTIDPEEYLTFKDSQTGITLPNGSGGTIYLLSAADEELQAVAYPGELDDDVAWAWFGGNDWQQTYTPTPGATNVSQPDKPCPAGQIRNPESDRCVGSSSSNDSSLKPCNPDQERNPATNRCRQIAASGSTLKPCQPGQERNPETNRCRSINSAASGLKPCEPDQERNPETNRCRMVAGLTTGDGSTGVKDLEAPATSPLSWWVAGIAGAVALAYGLWEWRRELSGLFSRRFSVTSAAK